jgi:hypothetical protein
VRGWNAFAGAVALIVACGVVTCGGSNHAAVCSDGAPGRAAGDEGCHCFPNATCLSGLTCASDLCVNLLGTGGGAGSGSGTGGVGAGGTSLGGGPGQGGTIGAGGTAGAGSGSGGVIGTGGAPTGTGGESGTGGVTGCGTLIDDFEANSGYICRDNGRVGHWFSYSDISSTFFPVGTPSLPSPLDVPRGTSQRALHTYGTDVQYAGIGCLINDVPSVTYNASAYTGIRFYIMGTAVAPKVFVQTRATEATAYGGTCPLPTLTCSANGAAIAGIQPTTWTLVSVPFSSLSGGYAPFNVADVWSIEFQPGVGAFDLWIDDLRFY